MVLSPNDRMRCRHFSRICAKINDVLLFIFFFTFFFILKRISLCLNKAVEIVHFLNCEVEIIRRHQRRGLLLSMHPDKNITVKTNNQTTQKQIVDFLISKKNWIEKNISKFQKLKAQFTMPTCTEGSCFPFLGEFKYLQFADTKKPKTYFKIEINMFYIQTKSILKTQTKCINLKINEKIHK